MKILLSNRNPSWGGGELWFFQAARELTARGHDVRTFVRPESKIHQRLVAENLEVVGIDKNPFAGFEPDVTVANTRKKDLRALWKFRGCPENGVMLRKGIARPIADRLISRRQLRRLSHILTNSDATSKVVENSIPWFPRDRITRIYNPVFLEPVTPIPGDGGLRILTVGRLVNQKGFDVLLNALALLKRPFKLSLAGTGQNKEALVAQARKLGIADKVGFLGHVDDVRALYAMADVVAIPSRYEGFCFTAAEAALAGLPIVATTADSLPEVARGATFVPVDDVQGLAAALESVEPGPRPGARAEAAALFAPDAIFDEVEALLERVSTQDAVGKPGRR